MKKRAARGPLSLPFSILNSQFSIPPHGRPMRGRTPRIEAAVMLAAVLLLALADAPGAPRAATFPDGLLSGSGRAAYLGTGRGLLALDLTTGAAMWRSEES